MAMRPLPVSLCACTDSGFREDHCSVSGIELIFSLLDPVGVFYKWQSTLLRCTLFILNYFKLDPCVWIVSVSAIIRIGDDIEEAQQRSCNCSSCAVTSCDITLQPVLHPQWICKAAAEKYVCALELSIGAADSAVSIAQVNLIFLSTVSLRDLTRSFFNSTVLK